MLQVVYCCNDKYFEGLYLSILSILRRSKSDFEFTILTANLPNINRNYTNISDYHIELLTKLIKSFNLNNSLRIIDCSEKYIKAYGSKDIERYSPYTMLKLFIPDYYESGNVLYIDTDIMANGDISSAWNVDMTDIEMCVCHDYYRQVMLKNPESRYFSGGVWLINIQKVKKTNLFNKAIEYFNQYHPFGNEEESLNHTVTNIIYFPNEYDYNWQGPSIGPNTILKHFVYTGESVNIKQWDIIGVRKILDLTNWDEDYKYFLQQKKIWIKEKPIYNVLYSCNDGIFDGLYLSILSILNRSKTTFNFYVMTANLTHLNERYIPISDNHIHILRNLIKSYNSSNTLTIIDCTQKYNEAFGKKYDVQNFTPYALLRLLADEIKELEGIILYLDVDTLANSDITQAWKTNMECIEICVCHDYWLCNNKQAKTPMFNSGVMLINLDFIRITKYFKKAILYLIDVKPRMADQEALFHTWYRIKIWDNEYRFNYQQLGIQEDTIIKHFNATDSNAIGNCLIKPWHIDGVQQILKLHNWDKDFQYFQDQKKHW